MFTRGSFLKGAALEAAMASFNENGMARALDAVRFVSGRAADEVAGDEDFWFEIQRAFTVDRTLINFNNGGVCPSPRVVQDAMRRYLEFSNNAPSYSMWRVLDPQIEGVRVTPNVYTTLREVDMFAEAMESIVQKGFPS